MLRFLRAIQLVWLLPAFCLPAIAHPFDNFPAETGWLPTRPVSRSKQAPPVTNWDLGHHFRIESLLCRKLNAVDCPTFAEDQHCQIDFALSDVCEISNVKIARPGKVPEFDQLAKRTVFDLNGSPELKLPRSKDGKAKSVSSFFHKAGASRWVTIRFNDDYRERASIYQTIIEHPNDFRVPPLQNRERPEPRPTDRQMLEYKNENGETRFKLVPVDHRIPE